MDASIFENDLYSAPFYYYNNDSFPDPTLIRANQMGCSQCNKDFFVQRDENYPFFTVHFILDGCGFFRVSGKDYLLKKGDAFLINAGEEHIYKNHSQEPLNLLWIELDPSSCTEIFHHFRANQIHTIEALHTEKPITTLIHIQKVLQENPSVSPFDISALYYTFLMHLVESVSTFPKREIPPLVTETLHYIHQNFTSDIPLNEWATSMHVSHTYLTRTFRKYMGTPPLHYINLKRLEYACQLLLNTTLTCEAVAEKAGFYDASHLHRMFQKQFGCSPSAYRKEHS